MEDIYQEIINNLSNHWQRYVVGIAVIGLFLMDGCIAYYYNKEYKRLKTEKKSLEREVKELEGDSKNSLKVEIK